MSSQRIFHALAGAMILSMLQLGTVAASAAERLASRIVNGSFTSAHVSTGALLFGSNPDAAGAWCSGTLVGCRTFLTAAHCVEGNTDPNNYQVFLQHSGFSSVQSMEVRPDYNFPVADIAVLKLTEAVTGIVPTPINDGQEVPFGTEGIIAGFGRGGGNNYDYLLKRYGEVVTGPCPPGVSNTTSVCWAFENPVGPVGEDSNTCNADSGGPLFVDLGNGEVVAGVTSGGNNGSCLPTDNSYDTEVFAYADWVKFKAGPDLLNTHCGGITQIDAEVDVTGFVGNLSVTNPSDTSTIAVSAGTAQLRIAMNAEDDGQNFDLYVKQGSPPTTNDFDCAAAGGGQAGYCEFDSPTTGDWFVLINRSNGNGQYQLTATTVPDVPLGLQVDTSSSVIELASGAPYPAEFTITNETEAAASFEVQIDLHTPFGRVVTIRRSGTLTLGSNKAVSRTLSLPLPPLPAGTTWGVGVTLYDSPSGNLLSESYASFDII